MACALTHTISLDCTDSVGGIKNVYVGDSIVFTDETLGADGEITDITGTGTFYQFETPKDTATYTGTLTVAPAAGTLYYAQELALTFHKLDAAKRNQLLLLAKNRDIKVVFEDNNGTIFLMGKVRGADASGGISVTGAAPGDMSGYTITLLANEPAPEVSCTDGLASFIGMTFSTV